MQAKGLVVTDPEDGPVDYENQSSGREKQSMGMEP